MRILEEIKQLKERLSQNIKIIEMREEDPMSSVLVSQCKKENININKKVEELENKFCENFD